MVWRARSLRHAEPPLGLVPDWLGWVSAFHLNVSGFSVVSTPLLVSLGREVFEVFVVQRLRLRYGFPRTSFLFLLFPPTFWGVVGLAFFFFLLSAASTIFGGSFSIRFGISLSALLTASFTAFLFFSFFS